MVTHNSIFADFIIPDFTRRVCLFEIRNQTVKDQPLSPSVHCIAQPSTISHQLSTARKELSSNELGRTPSHRARPLTGGPTTYCGPPPCQTTFCASSAQAVGRPLGRDGRYGPRQLPYRRRLNSRRLESMAVLTHHKRSAQRAKKHVMIMPSI